MDSGSFEERSKKFQEELVKLCKVYGIEIFPVLATTPNALIAQIRFLDLTNEEVLKKYGLKRVASASNTDSPLNPRVN